MSSSWTKATQLKYYKEFQDFHKRGILGNKKSQTQEWFIKGSFGTSFPGNHEEKKTLSF